MPTAGKSVCEISTISNIVTIFIYIFDIGYCVHHEKNKSCESNSGIFTNTFILQNYLKHLNKFVQVLIVCYWSKSYGQNYAKMPDVVHTAHTLLYILYQ